jgi:uncharacterized membrane protein YcaP (DUF421 family)
MAIRIFGKNELSQLSIVDLVFILLISNSVAATSLFIVNWLLRNLLFKNKKINQFIQGSALMLIYKGKVIKKHLDQANISVDELEAVVREHGVTDIKNVDLAVLEIDGNISILSGNFTKKSIRKRILHRMLNKSS